MRSTWRPAAAGESTTTACSPVRTVMRSSVDARAGAGAGAGSVEATGGILLHATETPARTSAARARCMNERDMVGLAEGDGRGTHHREPWCHGVAYSPQRLPTHDAAPESLRFPVPPGQGTARLPERPRPKCRGARTNAA